MIDAILIHPGAAKDIYQTLAADLAAVEQPLWCRLIAGYLRDRKFTVRIIDAEAAQLSPSHVAALVADMNPRLAVIVVSGHQPSASTQQMVGAGKIARFLKELRPTIPIIMTGNHCSALPVKTLLEEAVDFVCDGEGPVTIAGLLSGDLPTYIPGIVWRGRREVRQNPRAPLLDLDADLHGNAWDLLDMSSYKSHNWHRFDDLTKRKPYAAIYTSLGCSWKCSFCMINVFQHTNRYRMRSPEAVVAEMVMLNRKYGVESFKFIDEMFILNVRHYTAICQGIIAAGLGDKITSWCYSRIDTVKPEYLDLLRRAGFRWFGLGIESGSKHVRDGVEKGRFGNEQIIKSVEAIRSAGIWSAANYIFGMMDDTYSSMAETLALAKSLNTEWANFYCAQAYPGSALHTMARERGWRLPEDPGGPGWIGYAQHAVDCFPMQTETLSRTEVLDFRDAAFTSYFTDPSYLAMLGRTFDQATVEHVKKMTQHTIKRRHRA